MTWAVLALGAPSPAAGEAEVCRVAAVLSGATEEDDGEERELIVRRDDPMPGLLELEQFVAGRQVVLFDELQVRPALFGARTECSLLPSLDGAADLCLLVHLMHPGGADHSESALLAGDGARGEPETDARRRARCWLRLLRTLREELVAEGDPRSFAALCLDLEAAGSPLLHLIADLRPEPTGVPRRADPLPGPARGQPAEALRPVSDSELLDLFGPEGSLARTIPGFVAREAQSALSRSVACALNEGRALMAEAGTGVGKSLAYLVPALRHALLNQVPVVIATRTKNLQAQLFERELPLLREALGEPFRAALVKGRHNYLCLRRLELLARAVLERGDPEERLLLAYLRRLAAPCESGDLEEVSGWILERFEAARAFLSDLRCEHGPVARQCPFGRRCFYIAMARRAAGAHLLIANHALILRWPRSFPALSAVVIDEAHDLIDSATQAFGLEAGSGAIRRSLTRILGRGHASGLRALFFRLAAGPEPFPAGLGQGLEDALSAATFLLRELPGLNRKAGRLLARAPSSSPEASGDRRIVSLDAKARSTPEFAAFEREALRFVASARALAGSLAALAEQLAGVDPEGVGAELQGELRGSANRIDELVEALDGVLAGEQRFVCWIEASRARAGRAPSWNLKAAPVDVGLELHDRLLSRSATTVLTSATLRAAGRFDFFAAHTGFARLEEARRLEPLALGSPYDYERALRFFVPLGGGNPLSRDVRIAARAVARCVYFVASVLSGRTLVLFNSTARMLAVADLLRSPLRRLGVRLLCSGPDGSPARVLAGFRGLTRGVLLGSRAFFEGIDVRGSGLLCTIIERIPFESPADPVHEARSALLASRGESGFGGYSLPRAIVRLLQGSGRIVRSETDRGTVFLLDPRVASNPTYGRLIRASLPAGCQIGPELQVYTAFLERMADQLVEGVLDPARVLSDFSEALEPG